MVLGREAADVSTLDGVRRRAHPSLQRGRRDPRITTPGSRNERFKWFVLKHPLRSRRQSQLPFHLKMSVAHAIFEVKDTLILLCPHCTHIHQIPALTGRLVPVPAACDATLTYCIGPTMKESSFEIAIRDYERELERKRKQCQARRDKSKKDNES